MDAKSKAEEEKKNEEEKLKAYQIVGKDKKMASTLTGSNNDSQKILLLLQMFECQSLENGFLIAAS